MSPIGDILAEWEPRRKLVSSSSGSNSTTTLDAPSTYIALNLLVKTFNKPCGLGH